ncbi:hypothetical protein N7491_006585 [Penicillium cf. griseofulvum]|uniref:Uncharacterized protein n=1 Tax=Penicillium cf. griseofulvum TaxID=2972120 RepID=A0A9W9IUZ4_9EURO|nr:hypothetical protein N7472_010388 [Penicillium cf. griseofulvum]KAJ5429569.1 hypothetical protein N7491_006585 [Penicillium cf. griseofulvum]
MLTTVSIINAIITFCWIHMTTNASISSFRALRRAWYDPVAIANRAEHLQEISTYIGTDMTVIAVATLIGPSINGAMLHDYGGFLQIQIFSAAVM